MSSFPIINHIAKYLVILILAASFIFALYWLWQRQPKIQNQEVQTAINSQTVASEGKNPQKLKLSPKDFSVLTSKKVKFEGTSTPNSYLAIFSNTSQAVVKTDTSGNSEKEIDLADGLNLVDLVTVTPDFQTKNKKSLTLLIAQDTKDGDTVYTGPVKTIFDTLITLTTTDGQKEIRASKTTAITLPKEDDKEKESIGSALRNIRIGDFAIVIGNLSKEDQLEAKKIEIIREAVPQNSRRLTVVKTLTAPRQNLFSAKNQQSGEIEEFTLGKTSQILVDGKEAKITDITKDKNTIIISHEEKGKQLIDLIYLLP
ncbi:MAG: hypothetical protein UU05_C0036G0002 [Candidatus Curtissbacteria bacterium GW2011_GWA1_40_47]|uniref:Uncharacterized protein n=1 Tax=Candidatus Curtissbacteria bacterium RIFOXYA1_FULL_41_14 TaxID=1797737 RepID=A0A1F5HD04_9BACT|nr:MAG: hypothetical protein UT95_C0042G0002 [Candidatus Curtissbacteria bacterium GW2011_GWB1_40_28]KKR59755.1 MAG: hypothetical protein UT99_C0025G0005 [Candidatus Curtissbacteria bacterium GW2011_GWA2_40_31]KKR61946.1 MAG: hypothetical protein UU00_C0005G0002 [Microgenomates group bacterium GW2011_GWC1_40_35]KKR64871.1 MAG: hypothetical protein UU05_C0036G0002 [Candidatus Curtissbacteria bacterium GW2011_GWA1_40_47]KKR76196.1 MAG: hypothetical protein UU19_C0034G0005 [Candidatus Curtissbacte